MFDFLLTTSHCTTWLHKLMPCLRLNTQNNISFHLVLIQTISLQFFAIVGVDYFSLHYVATWINATSTIKCTE